jgi:hypothetical protein
VKEIQLSRGLVALVDDEDYAELSQFRWCADARGYAVRNLPRTKPYERRGTELMHRRILGLIKGDGMDADHIDGNKQNNQRSNLRSATHMQNLQNKKRTKQNKSGMKGVFFDRRDKKWRACINSQNKQYGLGYFDSPEEAHEAYKAAADRLHGEFANFG